MMATVTGVRVLLSLSRSLMMQQSFRLIPLKLASTCLSRRLCSISSVSKQPAHPENDSLLDNLIQMGVDVKMVRQRQPGVLRKVLTNEKGLTQFLQEKGASDKVIASIVSRYPRAITRSIEHLKQRWKLWRNVLATDAEIVSILDRSPESFFRSSDNENLEKNIAFFISLGLNNKDLHRLLTIAPRTFSNSVDLNKQMVELLVDVCADLGGKDPVQFTKTVISKNVYILIRSTKRVKTNIENLRASLNLNNSELLALLQGNGVEILNLSNEYLKKNSDTLQQKLASLGCQKDDTKKLFISYPRILYIRTKTLNTKLDCLLKEGITIKQILEKPKVLDYSTQNIARRLQELQRVGYDFKTNGINILDSSRKRFDAKIGKLAALSDN
ncbi:transcription termination factor 1, mitochondrial [Leuresthes tenuis]|uniref:transcription termination factor 1, mitochondrial n=1 Tax=Leuresthes tenuis TaxID=355514 RepID=UPI003B50DC07